MNLKHLYTFITIVAGCILASCHSEVDWNNIDTRSEVEMGLALPVGSIHATLGDFLGNGQVPSLFIDSMENKGVITWKDTFKIARNFHQVNLSQYISEKHLSLNVYDKLKEKLVEYPALAAMLESNNKVTGIGVPITLTFDIPLKLTGINEAENIMGERLDSALIDTASFSSYIKTYNLPLEWEWIDSVTLELGEQINRPERNTMVVYDKNRDHFGYEQEIPTVVDHFTINMMKKNSAGQYITGSVVDSVSFKINFTFTIPTGKTVTVPKDAAFDYKLGVQFINYQAIWGKFSRSKDMYDEAVIDLSESWGALSFISDWKVPFAKPKIDMHIYTQIAGAMKIDGDYLYALDSKGDSIFAQFTRGTQDYRNFPRQFEEGEYLDPTKSQIGDSTTNMIVQFSENPKEGHLDRLFHTMPQKLGYKFGIDFTYGGTYPSQIRITPSTSVRVEAACKLPLIFDNSGMFVHYQDTIRDVNLSQYSIDSLLANVNVVEKPVKQSELSLYLKAMNSIPLDIRASMRCLDEFGEVIMDPDTAAQKPLMLFPEDTITLKAPNFELVSGSWSAKTPGETIITAQLNKRQLDMLPKIKSIVYTAIIDDRSLQDAYRAGMNDVRITADEGLNIHIGLTAHIDAILNFNNNNNNK